MPNTEPEIKSKQPTGSSKRKRKQSIKRNIVLEDNSDKNDTKAAKIEKPYGKRAKADKGRIKEVASKKNDTPPEASNLCVKEEADVSVNICASVKTEKSCCENIYSNSTLCSNLPKQHSQNYKFCSEHPPKLEPNEEKDKQSRSKKKFPCEICSKEGSPRVYNSVEKHKHHMATVHDIYCQGIKRFECTDCPETVWFPTKSKFTYHLGTKHPGIIKFVCEVCTETFKLKANYKNHLKTHNIVVKKKFSCDICNGTFVNKAGFEAHKRRFPGPHIKQSCSHCGFSFSKEKHMKNHRCKTLLLEEAAARAIQKSEPVALQEHVSSIKLTDVKTSPEDVQDVQFVEKKTTDASTDVDLPRKPEGDSQGNKRVVFHRIIPRKNQEQTVYRPIQMQTQNVPESVVVQELREIDFEGGTYFAAAAEPEQQFIVRDINGHLVQGNQIFQLDINDVQPGEESQVYLADWNIVAPYVIREKSP